MSFATISSSLSSVENITKAEYHNVVFAENQVWFFSKNFVNQPTFNWGHRVSFVGGYAVSFDTVEKKWSAPVEFPSVSTEENATENIFVYNGKIYLLLATSFGGIEFQSIHKWTGKDWQKLTLNAPEKKDDGDEKVQVEYVASIPSVGVSHTTIVAGMHRTYHLYRLTIGESDAHIEFVAESPQEKFMPGLPVAALQTSNKVFISFGVFGCGFMWQKNRLIEFDEQKKVFETIEVAQSDDITGPPFFSRSNYVSVTAKGDFLHMTGAVRVGMSDSKYDGSIYAITNLSEGQPRWAKSNLVAPDGLDGIVVNSSTDGVYAFNTENTYFGQLDI